MFATPTYLAFTSRLVPRPDDKSLVVNPNQPKGALPALNENFGAPCAIKLGPFTSALGLPCQQRPWGYVAGVDLTTGETAWMHKNGTTRDAWAQIQSSGGLKKMKRNHIHLAKGRPGSDGGITDFENYCKYPASMPFMNVLELEGDGSKSRRLTSRYTNNP